MKKKVLKNIKRPHVPRSKREKKGVSEEEVYAPAQQTTHVGKHMHTSISRKNQQALGIPIADHVISEEALKGTEGSLMDYLDYNDREVEVRKEVPLQQKPVVEDVAPLAVPEAVPVPAEEPLPITTEFLDLDDVDREITKESLRQVRKQINQTEETPLLTGYHHQPEGMAASSGCCTIQ